MANISRAVQQLRKELEKELERALNEVERFGAALVALGSRSGKRRRPSDLLKPHSAHCCGMAGTAELH
jgi:hypothetical protein